MDPKDTQNAQTTTVVSNTSDNSAVASPESPNNIPQETSQPEAYKPTNHRKKWLSGLLPFIPLLATITLIYITIFWTNNSCNSLPVGDRGECGAGWIGFILLPIFTLMVIISLLFAIFMVVFKIIRSRKTKR